MRVDFYLTYDRDTPERVATITCNAAREIVIDVVPPFPLDAFLDPVPVPGGPAGLLREPPERDEGGRIVLSSKRDPQGWLEHTAASWCGSATTAVVQVDPFDDDPLYPWHASDEDGEAEYASNDDGDRDDEA